MVVTVIPSPTLLITGTTATLQTTTTATTTHTTMFTIIDTHANAQYVEERLMEMAVTGKKDRADEAVAW